MRRSGVLPSALALVACAGCEWVTATNRVPHQVESFGVILLRVSTRNPPSQSGDSPDKPMPLPMTPVEVDVEVTAFDEHGQAMTDYDRPVSFRVTPGDVVDVKVAGVSTGDQMLVPVGGIARGTVLVSHVFGETRLWAQDAPPLPAFGPPPDLDGGLASDAGPSDAGPADGGPPRTFAAGVSPPFWFVKPTLADLQRVELTDCGGTYGCQSDNRTSPFVGNFLTVDAVPPQGDMIVTAIGPDGFYVTDLLAQRLDLDIYRDTVGTFGSVYVYNYSYPDGLLVGDRVSSLTGTVQEFSGDTQVVFPSWVRVEGDPRPQDLPTPIAFDFSTPAGSGYRLCGVDPAAPAAVDVLCAYYNDNIEIESVESAVVKLENVKPSTAFAACDMNGNDSVPFFVIQSKAWTCFPDDVEDPVAECQCNMECVTGQGAHAADVCTELTNWRVYGQWVVVINEATGTRINVQTRDALPELDPRDFGKAEHEGCRLDITGVLRQVQAARPRFMVVAREEPDVCCRAPAGKSCPPNVPVCP